MHDGGARPSHTAAGWPARGENDGSALRRAAELTCTALWAAPCPSESLCGRGAVENTVGLAGKDSRADRGAPVPCEILGGNDPLEDVGGDLMVGKDSLEDRRATTGCENIVDLVGEGSLEDIEDRPATTECENCVDLVGEGSLEVLEDRGGPTPRGHRPVGELERTRCRTGVDALLLQGVAINERCTWRVPGRGEAVGFSDPSVVAVPEGRWGWASTAATGGAIGAACTWLPAVRTT